MKWTTRGWSGQGHNTKGIQRRMIFSIMRCGLCS
uniref:Uncharacterized protein n=1 Tax=Oryza punctata TaxID=4537 RepID=A0A0E0M548_ORYPU